MELKQHIVTLQDVLTKGTSHDLVGWVSEYAKLIESTGQYGAPEQQTAVRETMALHGIQEGQHQEKLDERGVLNKSWGPKILAEFIAAQLLNNFGMTCITGSMAPSYFVGVKQHFFRLFPSDEGSQQTLEHTL